MRLLYFCLICLYLLIATCFAFKGKNELLEDNLPDVAIGSVGESSKPDNSATFSPEALKGKALFKANCASCHSKNMKSDMTGPALRGVGERWEGREALLYDWIRNSMKVIASGDSYAVELYNKWEKKVMPRFENFTDEEIENILSYVNEVANK